MRRRLLAVLACVGLGAAGLVAATPAHADAPPPPDTDFLPCTGPTDDYCVETATANGSPTFPGADSTDGTTIRDYPYAKIVTGHLMVYGVYKDANGTGSDLQYGVNQAVAYHLVVRTGSFYPREMTGIVRNAAYTIGKSITGGWKFTLDFQPTSVHHYGIGPGGCSVDGGCVSDTTKATFDVAGFASGGIEDHVGSGLSAAEISQRTGMFHATNAQDSYDYYDIDTNTLVVRLANPHLKADGTPVTDGTYDTFLPNAYLTGTMGIPDPSALSGGSVVVTKTVGSTTSSAPFTLTHEAGGIRIRITGISFSRPTYRIHPGPSAPRRVSAHKVSTHKARVKFRKPATTLGHRINRYQARCHKLGKAWHARKGTESPITVGHLPKGKVYCQVRAHNSLGWGVWSTPKHT
jgi:hypothetical protein